MCTCVNDAWRPIGRLNAAWLLSLLSEHNAHEALRVSQGLQVKRGAALPTRGCRQLSGTHRGHLRVRWTSSHLLPIFHFGFMKNFVWGYDLFFRAFVRILFSVMTQSTVSAARGRARCQTPCATLPLRPSGTSWCTRGDWSGDRGAARLRLTLVHRSSHR